MATFLSRYLGDGCNAREHLMLTIFYSVRIKSGKFGHQENSDTHLQTV